MHSFKSTAVVATALFCMSATAQIQYSIDPNSVSLSIRQGWCQQQKATCPFLCLQPGNGGTRTTVQNTCDAATLSYACICGGGVSPNATEYSQTLPYFICTEYGSQCITSCGGVNTCQGACREKNPCGAQDPAPPNKTATTVTSAGSAATGVNGAGSTNSAFNGLGGSSATNAAPSSNSKSGGQAALDIGRSYGLAVVFTGLFAGFALVM